MPNTNDLSRSVVAFEQGNTLIAVIEMRGGADESGRPRREKGLARAGKAGMQHLAFAVDDLERAHAVLLQAGVQFARPRPFVDPDGNRSHFFSLNGVPGVLFEITQWARKP